MAPHHLHHRMRSADPNVGLRAAGTADRAVFLRRRGLRVLIATETRAASGRLLFRGCDPAQGRLVNRPRGATCDAGSLLHLLPEPVHRHEGFLPWADLVVLEIALPFFGPAQAQTVTRPELERTGFARPPVDSRFDPSPGGEQRTFRDGDSIRAGFALARTCYCSVCGRSWTLRVSLGRFGTSSSSTRAGVAWTAFFKALTSSSVLPSRARLSRRSTIQARSSSLPKPGEITSRMAGWEVGRQPSSGPNRSSVRRSPGRRPVKTVLMSMSGLRPRDRIKSWARSKIRIGSPMSSMYRCAGLAMASVLNTSDAASRIVIMNRVISGWVMVTGPPSSIWRSNKGTTLPRLPTTLPKRTAQQLIGPRYASTICSHNALVQPITECFEAALSVEIKTNRCTRAASAQRSVFHVPTTLVSTAWIGWASSIGTCL